MNQQQRAALDQQRRQQRGAKILDGIQDQYRQDGYSNMLNKYGTMQDNTTAYEYGLEAITDDMELTGLYEGNGLFAKIIDRPAEEAVKHGFDIDYGDQSITEYVEDQMDQLDLEDKFATAEKWARLYGGAIIVMLVDDGRGLEEPLDWRNVRSIEELRVFERSLIQPDYVSMNQFHFGDSLRSGQPFGEPEYYHVFSTYGYFTVHRSRCLVFRNGRLPERTSNAIYRYWGIPEYVRMKRELRECITAHGNGGKLLERCVQAIYKMKNLSNMLSTDAGENQVVKRLQVIDMARNLLNSIAIDNDGEEYTFESFAMSGVKDILDATCNMLSAVTNIPQTILFGRSPAGMNATGENDLENYYNMVENIQKQNMKANSRTVIDLILLQGKLEGKIPEIPKYKVRFASLWSMSETEQATVEKTRADTEYTKAQTAQIYMDSSVLDPSEVRKSLANGGKFDIEEVIPEDDLDIPDDVFELGIDTPVHIMDITEKGGADAARDTIISVSGIGETGADDGHIHILCDRADGGSGSGDWGHSGRPGKVGGSGGGGGKEHRHGTKEKGFTSEAKERAKKNNDLKKSAGSNDRKPVVSKISNEKFCSEAKKVLGEEEFAVLEDELKKYTNSVQGDTRKLAESLDKLDNLKWTSEEPLYRSIGVYNDTSFGKKGLFNELVESYREGNEFTMRSLSWSSDEDCAMFFGQTKGSHVIMYIDETKGVKNAVSVEGWQNNVYGDWYTNHTKEVLSTNLDQVYIPTKVDIKDNVAYVYVVEKLPDRHDEYDITMHGAASVLVIHDGKVLCASRSNAEGICGPGGKIEVGETPEEAAVREAQEEFHITPHNLIRIGDYKGSPGLYLPCRMYFTDQFSGLPEADGDEMLNAGWMTLQELQKEHLFPPFAESLHALTNLLTGNMSAVWASDGGPGSGNFGHEGRPRQVGGSGKGRTKKIGEIDPRDVDIAIQYFGNQIRNMEVEYAVSIDQNGNVYQSVGTEDSVDIEGVDLKGAVITHNHTESKGIASFGADDFYFLRKHQEIKELHCVDKEYTYRISVLKDMSKVIYNDIYKEGFKYMLDSDYEAQDAAMRVLQERGYVRYDKGRSES